MTSGSLRGLIADQSAISMAATEAARMVRTIFELTPANGSEFHSDLQRAGWGISVAS